jgi:hypothetical protein
MPLRRLLLVILLLPGLAACAPGEPRTLVVVLKSGQELTGELRGSTNGLLDFVDPSGDELPLARRHVRVIEGGGPLADPPLLWRQPPPPRGKPPEEFVRVTSGKEGGSLEVALAGYEQPDTGRRVYLVGAVHIAHPEAFAAQQALLDGMDLVLWEGVGGREKPSPEVMERFDVLFKSQVMLKNLLDLDFQLDEIDYERGFWRNSDMTLEAVQAALDERGLSMIPNEALVQAVFGTVFKVVDPQSIPRNPTVGRLYRGMVGPLIADPQRFFEQPGAEGLKEVLIELRNEVVLRDLADLLAEPGPERIGVYYGAGHLPDLQRALLDEQGLTYLGIHWITAWRW